MSWAVSQRSLRCPRHHSKWKIPWWPRSYVFWMCLDSYQSVLITPDQSCIVLYRGTCLLILALRCQVHPRPSIWAIEGLPSRFPLTLLLVTLEDKEQPVPVAFSRQELSVGTMQEVPCNLHCNFRLTYSSRNCTLSHQAQHFYIYRCPGTSIS